MKHRPQVASLKSKIRRGGPQAPGGPCATSAEANPGPLAFTLIELLVVVTIIAILLALLMPALDQAVYQAELARCGAQQKGAGHGGAVYATDYRRWYPDRGVMKTNNCQPSLIAVQEGPDDRPLLKGYIGLQGLIDPLTASYPIDPSQAPPGSRVFAGFGLWFGFGYAPTVPGTLPTDPPTVTARYPGMRKLGDRFEWTDDYNAPTMTHRFAIISGDMDFAGTAGRVINSHPDRDRRLPLSTLSGPPGGEYFSRWELTAGVRGPVDLNFAYTDGGVARFNGIELNDERVAAVPYQAIANGWPAYLLQLPRP